MINSNVKNGNINMVVCVLVIMIVYKLSMKLIVYNVVLCLKLDFKMRIDVSKEGKRMMQFVVVVWEVDNVIWLMFKQKCCYMVCVKKSNCVVRDVNRISFLNFIFVFNLFLVKRIKKIKVLYKVIFLVFIGL